MSDLISPFSRSNARPRVPARRNLARILWLETRMEVLKNLRLPIYSVSTLLFPVMFYAFFGLAFGGDVGATPGPLYYALTYGTFGVIGAALFGFGVGIAVERGQGWMRLKQASPMPPLAYFLAKIAMSIAFGLVIVGTLLTLSTLVGGAAPTLAQAAAALGIAVVGALPFSAIGLAVGYLAGPNSAPAVVNLIYLPSAFVGGLWVPIQAFPEWLQSIGSLLPTYHFAQLSLAVVGADGPSPNGVHVAALAAWMLVGLSVATWRYRRDEGATYG